MIGAVYRCFSAKNKLLYIGMSLTPLARVAAHNRRHWSKQISSINIEWFSTKSQAEVAERIAIVDENQIHNRRRLPKVIAKRMVHGGMLFADVLKYYGTVHAMARELSYTTQAIYLWRKYGIPRRAQKEIELFTKGTKGALKADKR